MLSRNDMFGITHEAMEQMVRGNPYQHSLGRDNGNVMLAMAILSDAQELIHREDFSDISYVEADLARKYINRAKFVLNQIMEDLNHVPT